MFDYEKCQYCGSEEVKYNPLTDEFVKCIKCGQTLRVASFEREKLLIGEQIEAREKAEEDLRQAQQEKRAAQKQLGDAVSALAGIQSAQESGMQALTELLKGQSDAKFGQQEIMGFMQAVRQEGRQGQDTLTCLMQAAIRNQSTNEERLNTLQGLAQDILAAGDNLADLVQACVQHIQIGKEEQNALINQLISWSKETHQEDIQRLESIQRVSHALQDSVGNIDRKVEDLGRKADETRQALDDLRGTLEEDKRNKLVELYHQANNALFEQRFEDASKKYMEVLAGGGKDAEVYWRIVLCHYCVEYQWDDEARLIPTLINPDLTEPERITARLDLERCISGTPQAEYYHQRLKDIDWILDRYRRVKDQMQYDVFISVKQRFENHRTLDSDIASDLYDHLKGLGLRVFNSDRCQMDLPLGKDAEPYIISALLSSRVLIVVGTNHDFMNAQWVRNEWSRFQWLIKKDEEKRGSSDRLLFCYLGRGMSPYEIPRALNKRNQVVIDGGKAYEIIDKEMGRIFLHLQPVSPPKHPPGNPQPPVNPDPPPKAKLVLWISLTITLLFGSYSVFCIANGLPLLPPFDAYDASQGIVKETAAPTEEAEKPEVTFVGDAEGFASTVAVEAAFDGDTITWLAIGDKRFEETPGLGAKALEPAFAAQFIGKTAPLAAEDIDAIAGATFTTNAVVEAVNKAYKSSLSNVGKDAAEKNHVLKRRVYTESEINEITNEFGRMAGSNSEQRFENFFKVGTNEYVAVREFSTMRNSIVINAKSYYDSATKQEVISYLDYLNSFLLGTCSINNTDIHFGQLNYFAKDAILCLDHAFLRLDEFKDYSLTIRSDETYSRGELLEIVRIWLDDIYNLMIQDYTTRSY